MFFNLVLFLNLLLKSALARHDSVMNNRNLVKFKLSQKSSLSARCSHCLSRRQKDLEAFINFCKRSKNWNSIIQVIYRKKFWKSSTVPRSYIQNHWCILAGVYLFNVNNGNTVTMCEICSKLTTKKSERRQWRRFGFLVNFDNISHIVRISPLLTLNK